MGSAPATARRYATGTQTGRALFATGDAKQEDRSQRLASSTTAVKIG